MNRFLSAVILAVSTGTAALSATAETVFVESETDVPTTMDALETAVKEAGATVFARIDHAAGAASVDMSLRPAQVLIFGNPKLGTPVMADTLETGLKLPLRVLVYEDAEGATWLAYEDPGEVFAEIGIGGPMAESVGRMSSALFKLTSKAAGK